MENIINSIQGVFHYRKDIGKTFSYKNSGVDINNYEKSLNCIKNSIKETHSNKVLTNNYSNFAGIYNLYDDNCLITSCDGVGSKSILAFQYKNEKRLKNLGRDVLINNLNDCLCVAKKITPITFIDYLSMNKINSDFETVIEGISDECKKYNISLIGGETSEMNIYKHNENMEIVGFINALCEKADLFNISDIDEGDIILGMKSSGFHTNGYSLIRKVLDCCDKTDINDFIDKILSPHKCYLNEMKLLYENNIEIKACAHITGGGIYSNINRIIPDNLRFSIYNKEIMKNITSEMNFIRLKGNLTQEEMFNTFNMGIGYCIIVNKSLKEQILNLYKTNLFDIDFITEIGYIH